jgi:hypothetical protein
MGGADCNGGKSGDDIICVNPVSAARRAEAELLRMGNPARVTSEGGVKRRVAE